MFLTSVKSLLMIIAIKNNKNWKKVTSPDYKPFHIFKSCHVYKYKCLKASKNVSSLQKETAMYCLINWVVIALKFFVDIKSFLVQMFSMKYQKSCSEGKRSKRPPQVERKKFTNTSNIYKYWNSLKALKNHHTKYTACLKATEHSTEILWYSSYCHGCLEKIRSNLSKPKATQCF